MSPTSIIAEKLIDLTRTRHDLWIIGYSRLIKECSLEALFDDPGRHLPRISIAHKAAATASLQLMGVTIWFSETERQWHSPNSRQPLTVEGEVFYIERTDITP